MTIAGFVPTLGDRILLAMRKAGLTQTELAVIVGKNQSTISRYVRDQVPIDVVTLQKIAVATGQRNLLIDLTELPEDDANSSPPEHDEVGDLPLRSAGCSFIVPGQRLFSADEAPSFN